MRELPKRAEEWVSELQVQLSVKHNHKNNHSEVNEHLFKPAPKETTPYLLHKAEIEKSCVSKGNIAYEAV